MSTRADKPRKYFARLLDTPEEDIDYREIPATIRTDWQDSEVLLPVTEKEFLAIENFLRTHRPKATVRSHIFDLFAEAMRTGKQVLCTYNGYYRELCPIILGHKRGEERALTYQFGGESEKGLPAGGQWRCLSLSRVRDVRLRGGPWYTGAGHNQPQGCVEIVDLDVNPASPYNPKRGLRS
jgi:hypothetical protein